MPHRRKPKLKSRVNDRDDPAIAEGVVLAKSSDIKNLESPKTAVEAERALYDPEWLNKVFVRDPSTISFILVSLTRGRWKELRPTHGVVFGCLYVAAR